MGHRGRMTRRNRSAVNPTTATDRFFLRASLVKARSTRENPAEPIRGQQNATANEIAVRQPSISNNEGPCSGTEDTTISELFASCVWSYDQGGDSRSVVGNLRVVRGGRFSSGGDEQRRFQESCFVRDKADCRRHYSQSIFHAAF